VKVLALTKEISFFIQNREPGAEEAFKILNHAFEMIGEPVRTFELTCMHTIL
jgi:hypothetical protein